MELNYIETYKGVKIYQYDDKYIATVYTKSIEDKELKNIKIKIDKIINDYIKKYRNLD